jgi:hypothetical protein
MKAGVRSPESGVRSWESEQKFVAYMFPVTDY